MATTENPKQFNFCFVFSPTEFLLVFTCLSIYACAQIHIHTFRGAKLNKSFLALSL